MILKSIVISPDGDLVNQLDLAFQDIGGIVILKDIDHYPHEQELSRLIRTNSPHVVFLGISDFERSIGVVQWLEKEAPGVQIAVFDQQVDNKALLRLMQLGIREFIAPPFHHGSLSDVLIRIRDNAEKHPPVSAMTDMLFSFLPSKPGSGTTTIAVNTALAIARQPDTNALLMDMDLNSGLVRFMLKIENSYSVLDAAEHALSMDDNLWPQLVTHRGRLDVLHSGKINPGVRMEGAQVHHMVEYARKHYKAICVDLSGNMEKYSMEIMQESKRIFLVCTPEIPSLHLAREKYLFLQQMDLGDKVSILLNRMTKRPVIAPAQIEQLLGLPIAMSMPNDYAGVHRALTVGTEVEQNSELGKHFAQLANAMLERRPAAEPEKKKKESKGFADLFRFSTSKFATVSDGESKS
ncbi:AAA family ATPase [Bryobacter aggregatus]|uniref:AAA family ATPase n=1 Tax=Bryobacter aggregatus TaxID=360054 RepID=UPI0004E2378C|nr:hypothetical protein [Bryobacter aggregatus]